MTATAIADDFTGRCEDGSECTQPAEIGFYCAEHALARYKRSTGLKRADRASLRASNAGSGRS